jgi:hypothetical protein
MLLTKTVIQYKPVVNHYARPFRLLTYAGDVSVKRVNSSIVRSRQDSKFSLYQEGPPNTEVSSPTSLDSLQYLTTGEHDERRLSNRAAFLRPARKQRCPKPKILPTYSWTMRSAVSKM